MKKTVRRWRLVARVLVLAIAIAAVPVPGLAQEKSPPASPTPGLQASIQKVAASTPVAPARTPAARTQTGTTASKPFMKSTAGIVMLAVLGAGVGYAVYSTSHDRIHSAAR